MPFLGADSAIVKLGQAISSSSSEEGQTQVAIYFACQNFIGLCGLAWFGFWLQLLAPYGWGQKILLNYSDVFSFGVFSKQGPSDQQLSESSFETTLFCRGYTSKQLADVGGNPDHSATYRVSGPETVSVVLNV